MRIHVIADSTSDIPAGYNKNLTVVPLTVRFGDEEYMDGVNLSHQEFYKKIEEGDIFPQTSQVTPYAFKEAYVNALKDNDAVICITASSCVSGTYQSAVLASADLEDQVAVIDSKNLTIGTKMLVDYALFLIEQEIDFEEIIRRVNGIRSRVRMLAVFDTLEYLKKGGRMPGAIANVGNALNLKPGITLKDGEVAFLGFARGMKKGFSLLKEKIEEAGGIDYSFPYCFGYTANPETMEKFIEQANYVWEGHDDPSTIERVSVGSAIGTHVGPGALAIAFIAPKE